MPVIDRNIDGTWLRIRLPNGKEGWVSAALVRLALAPTPATQVPAASKAASTLLAGAPAYAGVPAQLVDVVDGDTIKVSVNGATEALRYIGMAPPERGQPGFGAATSANRALLTPTLYLVSDRSDRDPYGRLLRYIYTEAGLLVNAELVRQGWAQPVKYPPDIPACAGTRAAEFRSLAGEAARAERGFWSGAAGDGTMPYAVTQRSANVRKGPGKGFATTTTLPAGTPLTVFGRTTPAYAGVGDWLQVRAPDRKGGWVSAGLVVLAVAVDRVAVASEIPAAPAAGGAVAERSGVVAVATTTTSAASGSGIDAIALLIVENHNSFEILELRNQGVALVDIGGWVLFGSKGDDRCAIPSGTVLQPGAGYQVATGESQTNGNGFKCGDKPIWNNDGETIYLQAADGRQIAIQSRKV